MIAPAKTFALLAAACALGACEPFSADELIPIRWLDLETFTLEIEPILEERCANPSCHGRIERPLSLYRPVGWRADPTRTFLREPLTEEELVHNYEVACVCAWPGDVAAAAPLALKPLGETGGMYHGGGVVFDGPTDPDYRAIVRWIEAGGGP